MNDADHRTNLLFLLRQAAEQQDANLARSVLENVAEIAHQQLRDLPPNWELRNGEGPWDLRRGEGLNGVAALCLEIERHLSDETDGPQARAWHPAAMLLRMCLHAQSLELPSPASIFAIQHWLNALDPDRQLGMRQRATAAQNGKERSKRQRNLGFAAELERMPGPDHTKVTRLARRHRMKSDTMKHALRGVRK